MEGVEGSTYVRRMERQEWARLWRALNINQGAEQVEQLHHQNFANKMVGLAAE